MASSKLPYFLFLLAMLILNGAIFLIPYLASQGDPNAPAYYAAFAPTCHQLTSRSQCIFVSGADGSHSFGDCTASDALSLSRDNEVQYDGKTGYKLPVCARDVAIYAAMLIGLLALPFIRRMESEEWPNKWLLVAACIPIGIDGGTQALGLRESSNLLRVITGAIVGVVLPFYLLPLLNTLYLGAREKLFGKKKEQKGKKK